MFEKVTILHRWHIEAFGASGINALKPLGPFTFDYPPLLLLKTIPYYTSIPFHHYMQHQIQPSTYVKCCHLPPPIFSYLVIINDINKKQKCSKLALNNKYTNFNNKKSEKNISEAKVEQIQI